MSIHLSPAEDRPSRFTEWSCFNDSSKLDASLQVYLLISKMIAWRANPMDTRGYVGKSNVLLALRKDLMTALETCAVETCEAEKTVESLTREASLSGEPIRFRVPSPKAAPNPTSLPDAVDTTGSNRPRAVDSTAPKPTHPTAWALRSAGLIVAETCLVADFVYRSFAIPELADLIIAGVRMAAKTGHRLTRYASRAPQKCQVAPVGT